MRVSEWSWRLGALYQPNPLDSYYASAATSFNTSGDAYSLSAANQNIPPEQSANLEIGAKLDSADKRFTTRLAAFYSTKYQERNTDPLVNLVTLSGKRHVAGVELDLTGRLTRQWEMFTSLMWMPIAVIDRPGWHLRALASPAGRLFEARRLPEARAAELAEATAPAWTFLSGPLSELSSIPALPTQPIPASLLTTARIDEPRGEKGAPAWSPPSPGPRATRSSGAPPRRAAMASAMASMGRLAWASA